MVKTIKKYKLIKEYPGSPKLNTEIIFTPGGWYSHFLPKISDSDDLNSIGSKEIKSYTEFWEEVIEEDYEILELISPYGPLPYHPLNNKSAKENLLKEPFLGKRYQIKSVKRLSDGEVFTIGDKIIVQRRYEVIESFDLGINIDNNLRIKAGDTSWLLKSIEHIKQSLFVTEDNVEIFEGDEFYFVTVLDNNNIYRSNKLWKVCKPSPMGFVYEPKHDKYFSTKQKAEDYIVMHKKQFSLREILDVYMGNGNFEDKIKHKAKLYDK